MAYKYLSKAVIKRLKPILSRIDNRTHRFSYLRYKASTMCTEKYVEKQTYAYRYETIYVQLTYNFKDMATHKNVHSHHNVYKFPLS